MRSKSGATVDRNYLASGEILNECKGWIILTMSSPPLFAVEGVDVCLENKLTIGSEERQDE